MKKTKSQLTKLLRETPLEKLVDVDVLQRVQDRFAETTGISAIIRDLQGRAVTRPSCQNKFCRLVNNTPAGELSCRASNARAAQQAAREHRVVKYVCHTGLSQFAAPIEVEGICVGTIVIGDLPEGQAPFRRLADTARKTGVSERKMLDALQTLKPWSEEELSRAISLLVTIANGLAGLCYQGAEVRAKLREISALYEVSQLLTSTLDLERVLAMVAKSATLLAGAKGCSIRLLDAQAKVLVIKSSYNLSKRYLDKGPLLVQKSGIDRAALAGEVVQIPDMLHDPRVIYPKEAKLEGIRSGISLGLISKKRPVGTLHLYSAEPRRFDPDEVRVLRSLANQAAAAIENAQLYQQSLEKRQLDRELRVAGRIQEQLQPKHAPVIEGYDIAAAGFPCGEVGGDFHDFVPLSKNRQALIIADVVGKGVPAALLMASARGGLRAHLENSTVPSRVVKRLNLNLCHDTRSGQFVSLFCGVLDPNRRTLTYTNAGHNPPLLLRHGRVTQLEAGGLVLGAEDTENYEQAELPLRHGDLIVFYTDGITEALSPKEEIFGSKRLIHLLRRMEKVSSAEIIVRLINEVHQFTSSTRQSDDISIIVLRVL